MKTRDMTSRQYAKWLHEEANMPYDEACNMSGYDPVREARQSLRLFLTVIVAVAAVLVIVAYSPLAVTAEPEQRVEDAFVSCLNGRGMVINGEVWVCTPSGVRGLK